MKTRKTKQLVATAIGHDGAILREWTTRIIDGKPEKTHWSKENAERIARIDVEEKLVTVQIW